MVSKQKNKRIIVLVIALFLILQFFPYSALAFSLNDVDSRIKDFFLFKVEKSDRFLHTVNTKVDQNLQRPTELITSLTRGGFSLLEKRVGVNEENKLYKFVKNATLRKTGFKLGVAEGMKDFTMGTASLLVQLNTLPARTINLAYNVKEKPQEYKERLVSKTKILVGALLNPRPVLNSLKQSW